MSGYELSSHPAAIGCAWPSASTSEMTAQIPVSGTVLDSGSSRLAGPAERTSCANGAVVYERPRGSANVISVSAGDSCAIALTPLGPRIAVLGGSLAPGHVGTAGYDCCAVCAAVSRPSVPSGAGCSASQRVSGIGQSSPS